MTRPHANFATTQWTLVWQAAREDSQHGRPALEQVIKRYWQPLYSFARRRGLSREDAEDATQEFLEGIVRGQLLESVDPAKGKFRAFLLGSWKHFLVDFRRRQQAAKRGGSVKTFSIDFEGGEKNWLELESREPDPDRVFSLAWASSLLDEVRQRLRNDYSQSDRNAVFEMLMPQLTRNINAAGYQALANDLNLSPSAVKVAMHRLRQRFGQTLRSVVLETIDDPNDIDTEISDLVELMVSTP